MRLLKIQLSGPNGFGVLPLLQQGRLRPMVATQTTFPMALFPPHVSLGGMQALGRNPGPVVPKRKKNKSRLQRSPLHPRCQIYSTVKPAD